jgi:hypothetical protein
MEKQLLEEVPSSSREPFFADERAIRETFVIVVQKIDDGIGKFRWEARC